ncbi:MAG: DUF5317 domain-containing protein [Jiangellaceae bacterium]|nr:DUF5317 domain-containing protein [Jiangellaceae bacterium]
MTLVLLALGVGLLIGYVRGGRLRWLLLGMPLRRNRLLLTALGLSVLGVLGGWVWQPLLAIMSGLAWLTIAYYAWVNRAVQGAALVAFGLAANSLVLVLNAAVPVSLDAAERADADPAQLLEPAFHTPAAADTLLPWLGKTVPVAFPPRPEVVSPGDVAVAAGLALAIGMGMRPPRRPAEPEHAVEEEKEPVPKVAV